VLGTLQRPPWTMRLFCGTRTCAKEIEGKAASRSPGKDRGEAQGPTKDGGMQVVDSETPGSGRLAPLIRFRRLRRQAGGP
jgi:hypothetical protein